jgi:hypothetical protein
LVIFLGDVREGRSEKKRGESQDVLLITNPMSARRFKKKKVKKFKIKGSPFSQKNRGVRTYRADLTPSEVYSEKVDKFRRSLYSLQTKQKEWSYVKKMEGVKKKLNDELKKIENSKSLSLAGLFQEYFTKAEDPEVMRVANNIYIHGNNKRRNKILLMSQNSSKSFGTLKYGRSGKFVYKQG